MGLAASQARLISLEARMSDLEYEGQQINQQRLTLSNKMNEVYNQTINMEVPTAPSKIDFRAEGYSGKSNGQKYTIYRQSNGNWAVTRHSSAYTCNLRSITVPDFSASYEPVVGEPDTSNPDLRVKVGDKILPYSEENMKKDGAVEVLPKQGAPRVCSFEELSGLQGGDNARTALTNFLADPQNDVGGTVDDFSIIITYNEKNEATYTFVKTEELDSAQAGDSIKDAYVQTFDEDVRVPLELVKDGITYNTTTGIPEAFTIKDENGETVTVKVAQDSDAYDEIAYDAAFREYEHKKVEYDHEQNELNKQTSIYQRQDKQLELKLTRLDNERNALKTEIDAVKKVIQDASESGFKTFSG